MDFGQFGWLRHHQLQKGLSKAFTPDPDVVHELKEAQVDGSFLVKFPDGVATTRRNNDQNPRRC